MLQTARSVFSSISCGVVFIGIDISNNRLGFNFSYHPIVRSIFTFCKWEQEAQ